MKINVKNLVTKKEEDRNKEMYILEILQKGIRKRRFL